MTLTHEQERNKKQRWLAKPGSRQKHRDGVARWRAAHPEQVRLYGRRKVYARKLVNVLGYSKEAARAKARADIQDVNKE